MTVSVYVLAAGQGKRFGGAKLDAPCAGLPLGAWALRAIEDAAVPPGVLIVPPAVPHFAAEARTRGWALATNNSADDGLSTSLRLAIRHADQAGHRAACIFLADMPLIGDRHVRSIVSAGPPDQPVATLYSDRRLGVPARFPRALFPTLATTASDGGASALLADLPTLVTMTDFTDLRDVDTPADLSRAETILRSRTATATRQSELQASG